MSNRQSLTPLFEELTLCCTANLVTVDVSAKTDMSSERFDALRSVLADFHNPHLAFSSIHVAGSKGKGSVCFSLARMMGGEGIATGCFLSPHVYDYRERIQSGTGFFDDELYKTHLHELIAYLKEHQQLQLRYFEALFVLACNIFRKAGCDYAVFETGIGGRLDTTNILQPVLTVITSIELEHTDILGHDLQSIATEKAGIIKPHTSVVVGVLDSESEAVIADKAQREQAPVLRIQDVFPWLVLGEGAGGADYFCNRYAQTFHQASFSYGNRVKAHNSLLSLASFQLLFSPFSQLPSTSLYKAIKTLERLEMPGRFEKRSMKGQVVYLDGAHTVASITNLIDQYQGVEQQTPVILFSCKKDKSKDTMLRLLRQQWPTADIIVTVFKLPTVLGRASVDLAVKNTASDTLVYHTEDDLSRACQLAWEQAVNKQRPLLVTGSFLFLEQVLAQWQCRD